MANIKGLYLLNLSEDYSLQSSKYKEYFIIFKTGGKQ